MKKVWLHKQQISKPTISGSNENTSKIAEDLLTAKMINNDCEPEGEIISLQAKRQYKNLTLIGGVVSLLSAIAFFILNIWLGLILDIISIALLILFTRKSKYIPGYSKKAMYKKGTSTKNIQFSSLIL